MNDVAFRDRSAALVVFGILNILMGSFCLLLLLGIAAVSELAARRGGPPAPMLTQNLLLYAALGFYFIVSGIGSIRARRWACAVILAVSWVWLVSGIISALTMIIWIPRMMVVVPPSSQGLVVAAMIGAGAVFYIILPLVFVLVYRSPHVRATCERRDPVPRWTDRVPLPVLAMVIATAAAALMLFSLLPRAAVPLFGTILTGAPAMIVILAIAGLLGFVSLQLYRLRRSAWWTLLLLQVVGGLATIMTFARVDLNSLYEAMGLMTPQVRAMHLETIARDPAFWSITVGVWIGYLAFVIWLRRYFSGAPPRTRAADTAPEADASLRVT